MSTKSNFIHPEFAILGYVVLTDSQPKAIHPNEHFSRKEVLDGITSGEYSGGSYVEVLVSPFSTEIPLITGQRYYLRGNLTQAHLRVWLGSKFRSEGAGVTIQWSEALRRSLIKVRKELQNAE